MNTFRAKFPQTLFAAIDHMNRSEHRRNVLPVCVLLFLFVVGMPTDRNRSPGRVPGSPWNLSIRPTRSPPPAYRLTASSLPSTLLFRYLEYYCPFVYLLASLILYRVSSPFLLPLHKYPFNFFTISLFHFFYFCLLVLLSFSFSVFALFLHIDLPISFRTSSKDFFSLHAANLSSG